MCAAADSVCPDATLVGTSPELLPKSDDLIRPCTTRCGSTELYRAQPTRSERLMTGGRGFKSVPATGRGLEAGPFAAAGYLPAVHSRAAMGPTHAARIVTITSPSYQLSIVTSARRPVPQSTATLPFPADLAPRSSRRPNSPSRVSGTDSRRGAPQPAHVRDLRFTPLTRSPGARCRPRADPVRPVA